MLGPKRLGAIGTAVLVLVGTVASSCGSGPNGPTSEPGLAGNVCPLTGTPAPGGVVPQRPAMAVKIGNEPGHDPAAGRGARPQSGLNEADIVYDTPTEGGIMRYQAIYQCQAPSSVGPIRSVRWIDWHILAMFTNKPLLVNAGGIKPDLEELDSLDYVQDVNLLGNSPDPSANVPQDGYRISSRSAPDNLYANTSTIWASYENEKRPPSPVFRYSANLPGGATPAAGLQIDFSAGTDVVWTWSAAQDLWLHGYAGTGPDIDALTNEQVSANNIVVQIVHYTYGPYAESPGASGDVEAQMVGSGSGYVLRNGEDIPVTWHRPTLSAPTTFSNARGQEVGLTPGRTWVEIVLDTTASIPGALTIRH